MFYLANSGFFGTLLNIFRVCMRFFCYSLAGPHLGTEALVSFGNFNSGLIWNFYFTEKTTVESTLKLNLTNQLWNLWHSETGMFFSFKLLYFTAILLRSRFWSSDRDHFDYYNSIMKHNSRFHVHCSVKFIVCMISMVVWCNIYFSKYDDYMDAFIGWLWLRLL